MFVRAGDREGGRHIEGSDSPLLAFSTSPSGERSDGTALVFYWKRNGERKVQRTPKI